MTNKFIQFEVWHECNNNCIFCHTKSFGQIDKLKSLKFIYNKLSDESFFKDSPIDLGLIGGEIFDGQLNDIELKDFFYSNLLSKISDNITIGNISNFYIATSLIFERQHIEEFIDFIYRKNIQNNIILCTSYDTIGRFHDNGLQKWNENMLWLHDQFPEIRLHTEMITTGDMVTMVLNGNLDIQKFKENYHTSVDFISPHMFITNDSDFKNIDKQAFNDRVGYFFPKREDFHSFINKTMIDNDILDKETFLSNKIRSDECYFIKDGHHHLAKNRVKTDGLFGKMHEKFGIKIIDGYLDNDIRIEDDIDMLFDRR